MQISTFHRKTCLLYNLWILRWTLRAFWLRLKLPRPPHQDSIDWVRLLCWHPASCPKYETRRRSQMCKTKHKLRTLVSTEMRKVVFSPWSNCNINKIAAIFCEKRVWKVPLYTIHMHFILRYLSDPIITFFLRVEMVLGVSIFVQMFYNSHNFQGCWIPNKATFIMSESESHDYETMKGKCRLSWSRPPGYGCGKKIEHADFKGQRIIQYSYSILWGL